MTGKIGIDTVYSAEKDDRSIGDIIRKSKGLSDEQVQQIVDHQRQNGGRFGDAAIALGLASESDVLFALSQQFDYPYASAGQQSLSPELIVAAQPFGKQAEGFRAIRSQLMMQALNPNEPRRAVAVISPDSGDGKTFFVANFGVALAQLGGRTLIVDADMRGPRLHQVFGVPNTSGLSGILSGRRESNVVFQAPDIPSLYIMPVGITPPNPLELVERPAFRVLMSELLRKFDHVIVDTPAAKFGVDPAVIAARCGAAIVLSRKGHTRVTALQELTAMVASASAKVAGVIVNEF